MDANLAKLKISTKQNLPQRSHKRNQLVDNNAAKKSEVSVGFIQALNSSLGHSNPNVLNPNGHNYNRRISPGRLPTNAQKAKSPGRDTCRHIAPREQINFELASHRANSGIQARSKDENTANYQRAIENQTNLGNQDDGNDKRIINFGAQAPRSDISKKANAMFSTSSASRTNKRAKSTRHIPLECDRILDAPNMRSDYYINPLDWSHSQNILAVALAGSIFLWNAQNGETEELDNIEQICDEEANQYISAVKFIKGANGGATLAVGVSTGDCYLFDIKTGKKLRKMGGHVDVINALDWNKHMLSSSCKDGSIFNHDVRQRHHHISSFLKHTAAVPGLSWAPNANFLASGSNDNLAMIWDIRKTQSNSIENPTTPGTVSSCTTPLHTLNSHLACVKAVAWSSRQNNVLATGGGTADRNIKIWNAVGGHETLSIDTNSQVCALHFSQNYDEIISCHGYQNNQLSVWSYPNGKKIVDLYGHEERVLHMTVSPDGSMVCSGSEDETLRFWKVFTKEELKGKGSSSLSAQTKKGGGFGGTKLNSMPRMR